jgi:succinyl-CoA synthetase beta subunit
LTYVFVCAKGVVLVGSQQGGVDIEAVAKETPDAIIKYPVDIMTGNHSSLLKANNSKFLFNPRVKNVSKKAVSCLPSIKN